MIVLDDDQAYFEVEYTNPDPVISLNTTLDDDGSTFVVFHDFSSSINPITDQEYYACDIFSDGNHVMRLPITSWQATIQNDRASYVQAVVPAASDIVGLIADLPNSELLILKGVNRLGVTSVLESEMARSPIQTVSYQEGPTNQTLTISGYSRYSPTTPSTRELKNLRSISSGSSLRVRASIDWFLRPGDTATFRSKSMTVAYINYYVNRSDQFMDVGERAL